MTRDQIANELVMKEERIAMWENFGRYDDEITEYTYQHKLDW